MIRVLKRLLWSPRKRSAATVRIRALEEVTVARGRRDTRRLHAALLTARAATTDLLRAEVMK